MASPKELAENTGENFGDDHTESRQHRHHTDRFASSTAQARTLKGFWKRSEILENNPVETCKLNLYGFRKGRFLIDVISKVGDCVTEVVGWGSPTFETPLALSHGLHQDGG